MTPRRIGLAVVALAVIGLAVILFSAPREPTYGGRTLSRWVRDLKSSNVDEQRAAVVALRNLGSEPIPQLRKMLRTRDTAARRLAERWLANVEILKIRFAPVCEQHKIAAEIVSWIGDPEVIPDLTALLDDQNCAQSSAEALTRLMPAATPALLKALTNQSVAVRWIGAANLGSNPNDVVISNLVGALKDQAGGVRMVTAVALGEMQRRPDLVVPALSDLLERDQGSSTRASVARALSKFGLHAKPAVPSLERLCNETNRVVASAAAEALALIRAAE